MKFTMTVVLATALLSISVPAIVLPRGGGEGGDPPKNFTPIKPATTARVAPGPYKPPFATKQANAKAPRAKVEVICDEGGCYTVGVPRTFSPIPQPTKTASVATQPYVPPFATKAPKAPRAKGEVICDEGGCYTVGVPRTFPPISQPTKTASVATQPYVPPFATKVKRVDEASVIDSADLPATTEFIERREEGGDPPKHFTPVKPVTTAHQGGPYVPPFGGKKGGN